MLIAKSSSTVTAGAIALAVFLLSGCSYTTEQSAPTQCPRPPQPDQRLTEKPCAFIRLESEQGDPLAIVTITKNNQCARLISERYTELQRWIEEQKHATE